MTTVESLPYALKVWEAEEHRKYMYTISLKNLQRFAKKALYTLSMRNTEFVLVCIEVNSLWEHLVDKLKMTEDWQCDGPIGYGIANWDICEYLNKKLPSITEDLKEKPSEGTVKVIVISDYGATVHKFTPGQ